ncbi:MAG: hypothetical protein WBE20_06655 [Candidatus Acidiferrales bacterium]
MKYASRFILCTASSLILAAAIWASPANANRSATHSPAVQDQAAPQTQSVSGTIASFDKTSFTLTVASNQSSAQKQAEALQSANTKTMTFLIDKNTTVDGTMKVDASADVTYRLDDSGNNVAISVHITQ